MNKRSQRVIAGNSRITVYPWTHPTTGRQRWRFSVPDGEKTRYRTFKTKADAVASAERTMRQAAEGSLAWDSLDQASQRFLADVHKATAAADRPAVLGFLKSRDSSTEVKTAVAAFVAFKVSEAGEKTPHLSMVSSFLTGFAEDFAGQRVSEIHTPELAAWLATHSKDRSSKTRRDYRANLISFWRWCLRQGFAGSDPITAPERLPSVHVESGDKRVLTSAELCQLLNAISPEWRAWAVLGAFGGLRPEEIAPSHIKKAAKRGLHCDEIDWDFGVIRIPACVSKVNRPRIVPLNDALRAGLEWAEIKPGMIGPTTMRNPAKPGELARLGRELFAGAWPQDALRHSYGSYRNAILRSLEKVAEEMGNSVAMLHRHYHNPQPEKMGQEFFALRPNCSDVDPLKIEWSIKIPNNPKLQNPLKSTKTA